MAKALQNWKKITRAPAKVFFATTNMLSTMKRPAVGEEVWNFLTFSVRV